MQFSTSALLALAGAITSVAAQTPAKFSYGTASADAVGVKGTNNNGPTNPAQPSLNTAINQTSVSRLASVNSVDDWCTFSSPNGETIADVEDRTVAYCTKPRNNARVIPDGTLTAVHFVKTPLYVQIMALGDFTKIGMQAGDQGGELDPHGATNMGNPVGGNVTSNVSGEDVFYEEWMNYVSYEQVCIRVCIAGSDVAPTPLECQHTLDEMGCNFVMPGDYTDKVFDTCDGDSAYPPGIFVENGQTSTFQQYFSSVATVNGEPQTYVNGSPDQATPTAAYSVPATSNCQTTSTIANGIASLVPTSSASSGGMSSTRTAGPSSSGSSSDNGSSSGNSAATQGGSSGANSGALPAMVFVAVASFAVASLLL